MELVFPECVLHESKTMNVITWGRYLGFVEDILTTHAIYAGGTLQTGF
jgi:hypothetical protein